MQCTGQFNIQSFAEWDSFGITIGGHISAHTTDISTDGTLYYIVHCSIISTDTIPYVPTLSFHLKPNETSSFKSLQNDKTLTVHKIIVQS